MCLQRIAEIGDRAQGVVFVATEMAETPRQRLDARPVFDGKASLSWIAELDDGIANGEDEIGITVKRAPPSPAPGAR